MQLHNLLNSEFVFGVSQAKHARVNFLHICMEGRCVMSHDDLERNA